MADSTGITVHRPASAADDALGDWLNRGHHHVGSTLSDCPLWTVRGTHGAQEVEKQWQTMGYTESYNRRSDAGFAAYTRGIVPRLLVPGVQADSSAEIGENRL